MVGRSNTLGVYGGKSPTPPPLQASTSTTRMGRQQQHQGMSPSLHHRVVHARSPSSSPELSRSNLRNSPLRTSFEDVEAEDMELFRRRQRRRSFEQWQQKKEEQIRKQALQSKSMVRGKERRPGDELRSQSMVHTGHTAEETKLSPFMVALVMTKFKRGKTHREWLQDKLEFEAMRRESMRAEAEAERQRLHALDEAARLNRRGERERLHRLAHERAEMKGRLLKETGLLEFTPPKLPESKFVADPIRPSEEEAWELGLEVLKMQDKISSIAPLGNDKPQQPKAKRYPKKLPSIPQVR